MAAESQTGSRSVLDDDNVSVTEIDEAWQSEEGALRTLRETLSSEECRPGGPKKDVVLLYISAHGMLDGDGEPCLLLGSDAVDDAAAIQTAVPPANRRLRVKSLLKQLGESLAPKTKKVLFLDSNRIDAAWAAGILYNGFAARLPRTVQEAEVENLYVLNSAGPRERGRGSPRLRASPFAHFVGQALERQDDRYKSGAVTLQGLCDHVMASVANWTEGEWHDPQRPLLLVSPTAKDAKDVQLAWRAKKPSADEAVASAGDTAVDFALLSELWRRHAELRPWQDFGDASSATLQADNARHEMRRARRRMRRELASWEAFQQGLLRYEQYIRGGRAFAPTRKSSRQASKSSATNCLPSAMPTSIRPSACRWPPCWVHSPVTINSEARLPRLLLGWRIHRRRIKNSSRAPTHEPRPPGLGCWPTRSRQRWSARWNC